RDQHEDHHDGRETPEDVAGHRSRGRGPAPPHHVEDTRASVPRPPGQGRLDLVTWSCLSSPLRHSSPLTIGFSRILTCAPRTPDADGLAQRYGKPAGLATPGGPNGISGPAAARCDQAFFVGASGASQTSSSTMSKLAGLIR